MTITDLTKIGMHTEYFGRFPLLEAVILSRFRTIANFEKEVGITKSLTHEYLKGRANPSFDFIKKCLNTFNDFTYEELFIESEVEEL